MNSRLVRVGNAARVIEYLGGALNPTGIQMYSFDATDTGIVVFPDNNDALFIENHHAVVGTLNYLF